MERIHLGTSAGYGDRMGASVAAMPLDLPARSGVVEAAERLRGHIVRTPLLSVAASDRPLFVKPEMLQRTGSFKIRGAFNFVASLSPQERARGVVAYSSGNHAQGVAASAADHGVPATIVMPDDAPPVKIRNTERLGARVVRYDRAGGDRVAIASDIAAETGAVLVPPYDHPRTIEGQGTMGLEIIEDLADRGIEEAVVVVPTSGGGLAAGVALAAEGQRPHLGVYTAEPATHDDFRLSLDAGERVEIDPPAPSICDALLMTIPGEVTFPVLIDRAEGGVVATDEEVLGAIKWAANELHLVVEPGGAVGLAAFLAGAVPGHLPVVAVLSGGNIDPAMLARALS